MEIDFIPVSPTPPGPTITDNNTAVTCNIYGMGIIKNTNTTTTARYECIKLSNAGSKLSVECDFIEGIGKVSSVLNGSSIYIQSAAKFHLKCNRVYNQNNTSIWIGEISAPVMDINLKINQVETGLPGTFNSGGSALITNGNGFINIDEVICRNGGHCFSHRAGEVTARIKKLKSYRNGSVSASTVHTNQGSGDQKLILYFDEILNLNGGSVSYIAIEHHQGTGIFIGNRIYSENNNAVDISGDNVKGSIKCNEITSDNNSGIRIDKNTVQFTIDANIIAGFSFYGCVLVQSNANLQLKNAKLINRDTTSNSRCIVIELLNNQLPKIIVNNIKAVTGNNSNGSIFYITGLNIYNYGLFTNKSLDPAIKLNIGNTGNYVFVESNDLS